MKDNKVPPQVIIVDDEEYILDFMKSDLDYNGLQVHSFSCATEALAHIEAAQNNSDCFFLITDYRMPEMSGLDMIESLQSKGSLITYSILLTGLIPKEDLERASKIEKVEVMEKPVDLDRLLSLIKTSKPCSEAL